MDEVKVKFQKYKDITELPKIVRLDFRLSETLEVISILLGFPENGFYRFGLTRTGKLLDEHLTFQEAGIQQNDQIIVIPGANVQDWEAQNVSQLQQNYPQHSSTVQQSSNQKNIYKLLISIPGNPETMIEYPISLDDFYEGHPEEFFKESDSQERKKLAAFLHKEFPELSAVQMNKLLQEWCEDISQGYRITELRIH